MTSPTTPAVGDQVLLSSYLINTRVYGYVVPATGQQEFTATYEIQGDQGTLTLAAVMGPTGPAGADMFALNLQTDGTDQPADLPETLTNSQADIGKTWLFDDVAANGEVIGTSAYVWYGTSYRRMMFGQPGPPGPVPIITPEVELIQYPGNSFIAEGGTPYEPTMTFNLAIPPGPPGPAAALALCPDVDFVTSPPQPGDVLGYTGKFYTTTLQVPTYVTAFGYTGGGSLTAGIYRWVVTAVSGPPFGASGGETTVSNEVNVTVGGAGSGSAMLEWIPTQGAVGYNIYRTAVNGIAGSEAYLIASVPGGSSVTFLDTGTAGVSQTPPTTNTAVMNFPKWVPISVSQLLPSPYSMPESAFTAYSGSSAQAPIGSFAIPPQPFPWTPIVWGHIGVDAFSQSHLNESLGNLFGSGSGSNTLIGCEVLLGDPKSGTLIGRGFGNNNTEVNIMPHYSTPRTPSVSITPNNALAVVPANHSNPADGTIYVNLWNDGRIGQYSYTPTDSQVFVMVSPVTDTFSAAATPAVYDTIGSSTIFTSTSATSALLSWTHNAAAGATIIVAIGTAVSSGAPSDFSRAATYNGVSMESIGGLGTNNGTKGWVEFYALQNAPAGPVTVEYTLSGSLIYCAAAQSVSYTNVSSFGELIGAYGASQGEAEGIVVAGSPGTMIVTAFNATNTVQTISSSQFSGTSRYNQSVTEFGHASMSLVVGDLIAPPFGGGIINFTQLISTNSSWAGISLPLIGGG